VNLKKGLNTAYNLLYKETAIDMDGMLKMTLYLLLYNAKEKRKMMFAMQLSPQQTQLMEKVILPFL